jgi:hypothetical protein
VKVFVSYSSKNRLRALRLAEQLLAHGVEVWYDEWEILVGHPILDSIYESRVSVMCLSSSLSVVLS